MGLIQEFKDFAMRGNVIDMAVGVVIGGAFGKIVGSFVEKMIMPLVGMLGGVDFSKYDVTLKPDVVKDGQTVSEAVKLGIGSFSTEVINFIIIAFAIFMAVKMMNTAQAKLQKQQAAAPPAPPEDVVLLREIRNALQNRQA